MKRLVHYEIEFCIQCPFIGSDINQTRYECEKRGRKLLYWFGEDEDKQEIPEWCPLKEVKE